MLISIVVVVRRCSFFPVLAAVVLVKSVHFEEAQNENKLNKRGNNPNKISSIKIMHKRIILNPNLKEDNVPLKKAQKCSF